MAKSASDTLEFPAGWAKKAEALGTATLCGIDDEGRLLVSSQDAGPPVHARIGIDVDDDLLRKAVAEGKEVLLAYPQGSAPVVVALLRERLTPSAAEEKKQVTAEEELILTCGKASIRLHKDGKVVVRGTRIVSTSSGPHKIKGASVELN